MRLTCLDSLLDQRLLNDRLIPVSLHIAQTLTIQRRWEIHLLPLRWRPTFPILNFNLLRIKLNWIMLPVFRIHCGLPGKIRPVQPHVQLCREHSGFHDAVFLLVFNCDIRKVKRDFLVDQVHHNIALLQIICENPSRICHLQLIIMAEFVKSSVHIPQPARLWWILFLIRFWTRRGCGNYGRLRQLRPFLHAAAAKQNRQDP